MTKSAQLKIENKTLVINGQDYNWIDRLEVYSSEDSGESLYRYSIDDKGRITAPLEEFKDCSFGRTRGMPTVRLILKHEQYEDDPNKNSRFKLEIGFHKGQVMVDFCEIDPVPDAQGVQDSDSTDP
jgi:hypothetical protein